MGRCLIWNHPVSGIWLDHGGWSFAFPPALSSNAHPAIWRVHDAPSVIIFQDKAGNSASIQPVLGNYDLLQDRTTTDGRHLVLGDRKRKHRLLITRPNAAGRGYFLFQDRWLRTRLAAIERFDPSCKSFGPNKSHDVLFPSAAQKHRLLLLLKILDTIPSAQNGVSTVREIAQHVIYRNADFGRTIEWKSSSHRRQTQRLINQARFFVGGGYRLLLRGRPQQSSSYS